MKKVTFEKAALEHKDIVFSWLEEYHVKAFWDNTQDHKDDIISFIEGRKKPSSYCDGKYVYWIATAEEAPFAMLMTILETPLDVVDKVKLENLSKTGNT